MTLLASNTEGAGHEDALQKSSEPMMWNTNALSFTDTGTQMMQHGGLDLASYVKLLLTTTLFFLRTKTRLNQGNLRSDSRASSVGTYSCES